MASPAFGIERVVSAVVERGSAAAEQAGKAGLAIFGLLFTFHLIEGAAELATSPSSCRLWHGKFWLRILLVAGGLAGYQMAVTGTVGKLQLSYMTGFAGKWADVWVSETQAIEGIKKAEAENQDLKQTEITTSKAGKEDDSWYAKMGKYLIDGLLTGIGWVLAVITGLAITIFILMEGFTGLGLNMLLVAVGPICIAFAAHSKTESYFWGFLKAFLFVGLLYMPLLGLACEFAGVIMAQMTQMVAGTGIAYGDGSDISVHFLFVIMGPCCAFAVVKAAPMFLSTVLGSGGGGGAGAAAMAIGASAVQQIAGGGGGESPKPPTPDPKNQDKDKKDDDQAPNQSPDSAGKADVAALADIRGE